MKRKRGHKKKKGKPKAETNTVIVNVEDNEILDERGSTDIDENKAESAMEVDTPPLSTDQQQQNVANVNADGLIKKGTGKSVGRVKVKLKTPKTVESQLTSSEACTQSDTDKSSQQRQGLVSEKMEDSANSLSKMGKKAGSIKIKSSNTLGSDHVLARSESPQEKESSKVHQEYNKQELDTACMIIKKVMEMDAAEPFNVRVDPEASGIPIMLKPEEMVIAKPGSMCFMSGSVEMENVFVPENEVGVWQWLFGKTVSSVVFHNNGQGGGFVGIAAPSLARILPVDLAMFGGEILCQKNLEVGEVLSVDVSCIAAVTTTVNVQIKYNRPMRRAVFGGGNLVTAVLTGPGIVFIQSLPFHRFSQHIARAVTSPNMRENPKFVMQMAIFFFLAYVVIVSSLILADV